MRDEDIMDEKNNHLILEICNKQNYEDILRQLIKSNKENNVKKMLNEINENKDITTKQKQIIYETIFNYINNVNEELIKNIKEIFRKGVEEGIKNSKI